MIKKEFIDYIVGKYNIKQRNLTEKDFILQKLIKELIKENYFNENFVFKGGTCLIKCYFDYYRFSEDLDFTWKKEFWKNKSRKQIRTFLSEEITKVLNLLDKICVKLNLDFKSDKKDKKYIEFGVGGIFVTFKLWYISSISQDDQFVKIQINFIEKFKYKFKKCFVKNLIKKKDLKEIIFLFPEYKEYVSNKFVIDSYDIKEILIEKVRAIITRRGTKTRDFIDVYLIIKFLNRKVEYYEKEIIEKTLFMLKYEKYLTNLLKKHDSFKSLKLEDKEDILLKPIDEKDFSNFIKDFCIFLDELLTKLYVINSHVYSKKVTISNP